MTKKQTIFKHLMTTASVASVLIGLGGNNTALAAAHAQDGALMIQNTSLSSNGNAGADWQEITDQGGPNNGGAVFNMAASIQNVIANNNNIPAITFNGGFALVADMAQGVGANPVTIQAINLANNNGCTLNVNENLSVGSIVNIIPDPANAGVFVAGNNASTLGVTIVDNKTLTLTGTAAAAANHGFELPAANNNPDNYTALGAVNLAGANATLVVHSNAGNLIALKNITGTGILTFKTDGTVENIGVDGTPLAKVNIGDAAAANVTFNKNVYATDVHLAHAGSVLTLAAAAPAAPGQPVNPNNTITGNITALAGGGGTLTFAGGGTVTGSIGTGGNALAVINARAGNVNITGDVFTTLLNLDAGKTTTIGGGFTGKVDFNAARAGAGETLTFNSAGDHIFDATILHGANGTLNVEANLKATNAEIGNIAVINIGNAKTLTIDAKVANVTLLNNQAITFMHEDSVLKLVNSNALAGGGVKTITFADHLNPGAAGKGIVHIETAADNLKIDGNNKNLGIAAGNTLKKVTITSTGGEIEIVPAINTIALELNSDTKTTTKLVTADTITLSKAVNWHATENVTGAINFANAGGGKITLTGAKNINGAITTATNGQGKLTFLGVSTVTGDIGNVDAATNNVFALEKITLGNGQVDLGGNVWAQEISLVNAGSILKLANTKTITGAITATGNYGTLTFAGGGTVVGHIGTGNALAAINAKAGNVNITGNVFTTLLNLDNGTTTIDGDFTGEVDFVGASILKFTGAPHTFASTILHGANGTLNVEANLTATHSDIGKIATINIGVPAAAGPPITPPAAKTLTIDAKVANVEILGKGGVVGAANQAITFMHEDSVLRLLNSTDPAGGGVKTITFADDLDPGAAGKGIVHIETAADNLKIDGAFTLGNVNKLKEVKITSTAGKIEIVPAINTIALELNSAIKTTTNVVTAGTITLSKAVNWHATKNVTGAINFANAGGGKITLTDNKKITGAITTATDGQGKLDFLGAGEVTGDIGAADKKLEQIEINGAHDVVLGGNVYTDKLLFTAVGPVKIGGNFGGAVDFTVNGGTLTFNGAGDHTFAATITNGNVANAVLNVEANLKATHSDIGKIKTINIGNAGAGNNKTLTIDASAGNVELLSDLGARNHQKIEFLHNDSVLKLYSNANSTITFHKNLEPIADNKNKIRMEGVGVNTLTVQSATGAETLGIAAKHFAQLDIAGKVTIVGIGANKLDIQNINKLNVFKEAEFLDQSGTSGKIGEIHIGAADGAGAGEAKYILDSVEGDCNLNAVVRFEDNDARLVLKNSSNANDRTITLANNLDPGAPVLGEDSKGIVELNASETGRTLTISGGGANKTLGTNTHYLKELIYSGNGEVIFNNITPFAKTMRSNGGLKFNDFAGDLIFNRSTTYEGKNVTGSVKFEGHQGTLKLTNNGTITGDISGGHTTAGTVEFVENGTAQGLITAVKYLKAGNGNVTLSKSGDHSITEIQGTGTNNLILADGFNLTGSINSTNGLQALGLKLKRGEITGTVGAGTPVGNIEVLENNFIFNDTVNSSGDIIISDNASAEFKLKVTAKDIKGAEDGKGSIKFINESPLEVDSTIGVGNTLGTMEIAGTDVTVKKQMKVDKVKFSSSNESTLTLGNADNTINNIEVSANNLHTLALAGNLIVGDVGTEANKLKSMHLLGDHTLEVNGTQFNSDVPTETNDTGTARLNTTDSSVYNLGTRDKRLKKVEFAQNATVKGDVYAATIDVGSNTAIFAGTKARRLSMPKVSIGESGVPRRIEQLFVYNTFLGSNEITGSGSITFAKGVVINAPINNVGTITFADNVWLKEAASGSAMHCSKYTILEKDINFSNIEASGATIIAAAPGEDARLSITGGLSANNLTIDLGTNQVKYTGQGKVTGDLKLHTFYNTTTSAGGNIEIQPSSKLDLSELNNLHVDLTAETNINDISDDTEFNLISSSDGIVPVDNNKITFNADERNRFVVWTIDSDNLTGKIKVKPKDKSDEELDKDIKEKREKDEKDPGESGGSGKETSGEGGSGEDGSDSISKEDVLKQDDSLQEFADLMKKASEDSKDSNVLLFKNDLGKLTKEGQLEAMGAILNSGDTQIAETQVMPDTTDAIGSGLTETITQSVIAEAISQPIAYQAAVRINDRIAPMQNPVSSTPTGSKLVGSGDDDKSLYGAWAAPFYGTARQQMRHGISGYAAKSFGGMLGFDGLITDDLLLGAAYARVDTKIDHKNKKIGDKTEGITNLGAIYGLYKLSLNWFTEVIGLYSSTDIKNLQARIIPGETKKDPRKVMAEGKYKSTAYSGQVLTGYNFLVASNVMFTPTVGIRYSKFMDSGYTETGTKHQNLTVKKKDYDKLDAILGLRLSASINIDQWMLLPEVHGSVNHLLKGKSPIIDARMNGIDKPLPLFAKSLKPVKTSFTVGGGITAHYNMIECGITYNANLASKYMGHQGTLKLKVNF